MAADEWRQAAFHLLVLWDLPPLNGLLRTASIHSHRSLITIVSAGIPCALLTTLRSRGPYLYFPLRRLRPEGWDHMTFSTLTPSLGLNMPTPFPFTLS